MRILVAMVMSVLAFSCGDGKDDGWDLGDEPIVIWTIPRPGEEAPDAEDSTPDVDEPDAPERPTGPAITPNQPSVSPVTCDAEFRSVTAPGSIEGALPRGRGRLHEVPCADAPGSEQRFHIDVPRRMGVEIWTTYRETEFPPVLLLQAGCGDDTTDLYCSSPIGSHPEPYSAHLRAQLEPGRYTLIVDERNLLDYGEGGAFVVHIDEVELGYNAMCENADTLYPDNIGTVFQPNRGSTGDLRSCFATASSRHFWTMTVAPHSANRVVAEYETDDPDVQQGPYIQVSGGCYEACDPVYGPGSVAVANDTDEYVQVVVAVTDSRGLPYSVYLAESAELAANGACEMATAVAADQTIRGGLLTASVPQEFCGFDEARQLYYTVDVPSGHQLIPQITGARAGLMLGCDAGQCLERAVNRTGATQTYTVAIANWSEPDSDFEFTPRVVRTAANSTCSMATRIPTDGSPTSGALVTGGDPGGACGLVHAVGFTLWYSVEVPPMQTVTVEVEPEEQFGALGVEAMDSACDGACLGTHDPYLNGPGKATLELTNDAATARLVWLAVTSETPDVQPQRFEIRAIQL